MKLDRIRITETPGQTESLALSLQAIAASQSVELDYDNLCAALGASFATVSTLFEAMPGWWMTYGRDLFLEPAARLFGFWLRPLQPPETALALPTAEQYPQHWELSYVPLIRRAIENGQPVLVWRGWPDSRGAFWGVITQATEAGLAGTTLWSHGELVPLSAPAMQCYVVEGFDGGEAPCDQLLSMALQHADAFLNRAPFAPPIGDPGPAQVVTGPAAFDAWEHWFQGDGVLQPGAADEQRQHAEFVSASHRSATRFLRSVQTLVGEALATTMTDAIEYADAVVQWLEESRDAEAVAALMGDPHGRQRLLAAVHAAEAAERLLASRIEELAAAMSESS